MDVRLSPEQRALRDTAARVVGRLALSTVRDLEDDERRAKLDAAVAGSGWRELRAPGDGGRPLATAVEAALVAEELAAGLADVAYLGPVLAADLRRLTGDDTADLRRLTGDDAADLRRLTGDDAATSRAETVVLTEDLSRLADIGPEGLDLRRAVAVDAAGAAQGLAVRTAPDAGDAALVTVALGPTRDGVDLTRPSARPAEPATPAAVGRIRPDDLDRWRALALALTCADLVGAMRGAVDLGREYVTARHQYGVPVGSFQAVQHLLADAHVATEGSRSVALHAAWAVDALSPAEAVTAGAVAKAYCARAARSVVETVIQVHGGIGHTWECTAHLYLRRALLSTDVLGGVGPSLERVLAGRGLGGNGDGLL